MLLTQGPTLFLKLCGFVPDVTWLIHMCDVTHTYVRHDSYDIADTRTDTVSETLWFRTWRDMTHSLVFFKTARYMLKRGRLRCRFGPYVTWLIHICNMTHSHVRHDSFVDATWLIHMCNMTHSYVQHGSFTFFTWIDMTHSCAIGQHQEQCQIMVTHEYGMSLIGMSHVAYGHVTHRHDSIIGVTRRATWLIHIYTWRRYVTHMNTSSLTTRATLKETYLHQKRPTKETHSYECHSYEYVLFHMGMSLIWMSHVAYGNVTHMNMTCHS